MKRHFALFVVFCFVGLGWIAAQNISYGEYYFNDDPGFGNGTPLTFAPDSTVQLSFTASGNSLEQGLNFVFVRFRTGEGLWSHTINYPVLIRTMSDTTASVITAGEMYFDEDPGFGNGTPLSFTPGSPVQLALTVPMDQLTPGRHHLYLRFQNAGGAWSHTAPIVMRVRQSPILNKITGIEYAYDEDSNFAKFPAIGIPKLDLVDSTLLTQTTGLPLGEYTLLIRAVDEQGRRSHMYHLPVKVCTTYGPKADFEPVVNRTDVHFLNNSTHTDTVAWDFGDGNTDSMAFSPRHEYVPGNYTACLEVSNGCGRDTLCRDVIVPGISHVYPTVHSNDGMCFMDVYGGALETGSTARLFNDGAADIEARKVDRVDNTHIGSVFNFREAALGHYHLEVTQANGRKDTLLNAIELVPDEGHDLWIDMPGRERLLVNREYRYQVLVGNQGTRTAFGVPLYIKATPGTEIVPLELSHQDSIDPAVYDSVPYFFYWEDPYTEDTSQFGTFIFPRIRPGEVVPLEIKLKHPSTGKRPIEYHLLPPQYTDSEMDSLLRSGCGMPPCMRCALDLLGVVPFVGCATGLVTIGCDIAGAGPGGPPPISLGISVAATAISCWNPSGLAAGLVGLGLGAASSIGSAGGSNSCGPGGCNPRPKKPKPQNSVGSLDPNVKIGPTGFTNDNYIRGGGPIIYTIYFENADTATAPANEVIVVDTLDANLLDLGTLRFMSFGFGDTSMSVLANREAARFVRDIDLRPARQTIVRVIGEVDTNGVLTTTYTSLDPETMKLVDDPFNGFLPPNLNPPEGEGFIQFMVNLKPGFQHLDRIENKAAIYFDANDPIETPEWTNTIDLLPPSSSVNELPASLEDTVFNVTWGGTDAHAGVMDYDIYVIEDDTLEYQWKVGISKTSAAFSGSFGKTYKFYSVARDNVGNEEAPPSDPVLNPDAEIELVKPSGFTSISTQDFRATVHPNPAGSVAYLTLHLEQAANYNYQLISVSGSKIMNASTGFLTKGSHRITLPLANISDGVYILEINREGSPSQFLRLSVAK